MSKMSKGKLIGITGGIASGKSTVTTYLRQKGYPVIDADQLVHQLQQKGGKLYDALVDHFGRSILDNQEQLTRSKLADMIFTNPVYLAESSKLQDAIIRDELQRLSQDYLKNEPLVFMDIPLLFERDYQSWFDEIWLVYVSENQQLERLMQRNGYTKDEAIQRMTTQMSVENKRLLSQKVIDNTGSFAETFRQLDDYLNQLEKGLL